MLVAVRAAVPAEYEAIGELTARAYLDDGLVPAGSNYQESLRRAAHRAEHAELLVAAAAPDGEGPDGEGPDGEGPVLLGTVSFVRPGSRYCEVAVDGEAEFRMLAVAPEARGRGVGRALAQACVERARAVQASRVVISTHPDMAAAHRLYESLGFTRLPDRDWRPLPDVALIAYVLELASVAGQSPS